MINNSLGIKNLTDIENFNEAEVEIRIFIPFLNNSEHLNIDLTSIKPKKYLESREIDKVSGKNKGYFPDFSVWIKGLPVMICEAKAPSVDVRVGYREAQLYASILNTSYPKDINPAAFVIACNGLQICAGTWDAEPAVIADLADLEPGTSKSDELKGLLHEAELSRFAKSCSASLRRGRYTKPISSIGGQDALDEQLPYNTFGAELAPHLARLFTSNADTNDPLIYDRGYVTRVDTNSHGATLDALLKDRAPKRISKAVQEVGQNARTEKAISSQVSNFHARENVSGHLQLLIGGVGAGKSLFARRYKELLAPASIKQHIHWAFIDFNGYSGAIGDKYKWLYDKFRISFSEENDTDIDDLSNLRRYFSDKLQKNKAKYDIIRKQDELRAEETEITDLYLWRDDPEQLALGIFNYIVKTKREILFIVCDNVDRLKKDEQFEVFNLAIDLKSISKAFVLLQLRDSTYERHKSDPPLDTFKGGLIFHVTPPRFTQIIQKRIEILSELLIENTSDTLEYTLPNGYKVMYPNTNVGNYLQGIYHNIFQSRKLISSILEGVSGRDMRRALEMFRGLLISGHLPTDVITSSVYGGGEFRLTEYKLIKMIMRTEYRFHSSDNSFIKSIFEFSDNSERPNNFIVVDILGFLSSRRKVKGDIGSEGYFLVSTIANDFMPRGYAPEDVFHTCQKLLENGLIESDKYDNAELKMHDAIKINASGYIHYRVLPTRLEYIYGILANTQIFDKDVAENLRESIISERKFGDASMKSKLLSVERFYKYLEAQFNSLQCDHLDFGFTGSGAQRSLRLVSDTIDKSKDIASKQLKLDI